MTNTCHVCGVGRPEHPRAESLLCHACRCAMDRYGVRAPDAIAACEREAKMRLHEAIVNLRRVKAATVGIAKLGPYNPLPEHRGAVKNSTP